MKIRLGVLFGGRSVENEISVITAVQAINAIDAERYDVVPVYIAKNGLWYTGSALLDTDNYRDMPSLLARCQRVCMKSVYGDFNLYREKSGLLRKSVIARLDAILPALHGTNCEDGTLQGVLDTIGIPYAGCNTLASANGMDKITMKMILKECGLPVADYVWFSDKRWYDDREGVVAEIESKLAYPVIVKPANSGSSVGISPAHNREELIEAVAGAEIFTTRIIVEHMITALKEVNCSVLGDYYDCQASACEVPMRSGEILSYADKYEGGGSKRSEGMHSTQRELPANLPEQTTEQIRSMAVGTFRALACDGVARIDFMIDENTGEIFVNEINTIPGSLSFYLWEYSGIPFGELIDRLVELAFRRKREAGLKTVDFGGNIFASMKRSGGKFGAKGAKSGYNK